MDRKQRRGNTVLRQGRGGSLPPWGILCTGALLLFALWGCRGGRNEPFSPRIRDNPLKPLSEASLNALILDGTISQFFSAGALGVSLVHEGRWRDLSTPFEERSSCAVTTVTYTPPATLEVEEEIKGCPVSAEGITASTRGEARVLWEGEPLGFSAVVSVPELSILYSNGDGVTSSGAARLMAGFEGGGRSATLAYEFRWQIWDLRLGSTLYEGKITATAEEDRYVLRGYWRLKQREDVAGFLGTPEPLLDYTRCLLQDPRGGVFSFFPLFPVEGRVALLSDEGEAELEFSQCSATLKDPEGSPLFRFEGEIAEDQRAFLQSWGGVIPGIRQFRLSGLSLFAIALELYRYCREGSGDCYQFQYLPELDPGGTSLLRFGNFRLLRGNEEFPGGFEITRNRLTLRIPDLNVLQIYQVQPQPLSREPLRFLLIPEGGGDPVTFSASPWVPPSP